MVQLIPLNEARERIGVSKNTLRRLIERHNIMEYENPRDRRETLIDIGELEAAMQPVPIRPKTDEMGKAAA